MSTLVDTSHDERKRRRRLRVCRAFHKGPSSVCQRSLTFRANATPLVLGAPQSSWTLINCPMTVCLELASTGELSMAWRSPTNRLYGPGRFFSTAPPRAACALSPPKRPCPPPLSAPRELLRAGQSSVGRTFRKQVRLLERLRGSSRRALPRLWRRGSGLRPDQVRYMWCGTVVDAELQTERALSVMRCEAGDENARPGVVCVPQTFGSLQKPHPHAHCLVSRGLWNTDRLWIPLPYIDTNAAEKLFRHKTLHFLKRKGLLSDERIELLNSFRNSGFSVDTSPTVWPQDSDGLERLGVF